MSLVLGQADHFVSRISEGIRPALASLNMETFANHWHIAFASMLACFLITAVSERVSPQLFPKAFQSMKGFQKTNWHIHVVSLVHSIVSLVLSYPLINHPELTKDPIGVYWPHFGNVTAISTGYFLWDIYVCLRYIRQTGIGFFLHGFIACFVSLISFRPFINMYGPMFIMVELSTPFLNIHWFMDKLKMTGSMAQLINGVFLLGTYFLARLLYAPYLAYCVFSTFYQYWGEFPAYLGYIYVVQIMTLVILNFVWFNKMVKTLRSRFESPTPKKMI
ncbi:TLC domain-containing protein [Dimargaris cristalligena]|uniref:TLC domain-containing protein n=1 Tax=Dimargaris cristalligena TaxID=215637 RepID=A0A4Q0A4C3_9FUNG|nr:TLC domain-containing protein [Dimargaris cristalligena]|eukprot:RKP40110.1 TLC domain-containing protein [Dimargaris cristalligena]